MFISSRSSLAVVGFVEEDPLWVTLWTSTCNWWLKVEDWLGNAGSDLPWPEYVW